MDNWKSSRLWLAVLLLTVADQGAKLVIHRYFFHTRVSIVPGIASFHPVQNRDLSWGGSLGIPLLSNFFVAVGINLAILAVGCLVYRSLHRSGRVGGRLSSATFALLFAGVVCSTVDRVLWNGSIDYIRLENLFTFDLKDCYVTGFQVLLVYSFLRYQQAWKELRVRDLLFPGGPGG